MIEHGTDNGQQAFQSEEEAAHKGAKLMPELASLEWPESIREAEEQKAVSFLEGYALENDYKLLTVILELAKQAHTGVARRSSTATQYVPYISHPTQVAEWLVDAVGRENADEEVLVLAIGHDLFEDTAVEAKFLQEKFLETGATTEQVERIIIGLDLLTKKEDETDEEYLGNILRILHKDENETEEAYERRIIEGIEWKVALVKLMDRGHNLVTYNYKEPSRTLAKAQETKEYILPILRKLQEVKPELTSDLESLADSIDHFAQKAEEASRAAAEKELGRKIRDNLTGA